MRTDIDTNYFKTKLEEELKTLERELEEIGRKNPSNKADWEAESTAESIDPADDSEKADSIEEYESNAALLKNLEIKYNDVKDALAKIEKGTYGFCEVCNAPIEEERLIANQSARTCKAHME